MTKYIRNFSIIAHVDHGKSTLSDRIIEICGGLDEREIVPQVLDSMELERERGITIKSQSVTLNYVSQHNKESYQLNLIDTPGHVDFSYEVSRSLAACEGALLVIDSSQGVEAQTIANYQIAIEMSVVVLVVLNKIDLSISNPDRILQEIRDYVGINTKMHGSEIRCSAKTGFGIVELLERIIQDIPCPRGKLYASLQALVIDSWFNNYLGIVSLVCIKNGRVCRGDILFSMHTGQKYIVNQMGIFSPKRVQREMLCCGEVGWITYVSKNVMGACVGDTLTALSKPATVACSVFIKKAQHYVYAGFFAANSKTQNFFRDALYKLSLNDSSFSYVPESSELLGFGFRCGFLGLLHMEIIQERLRREYLLDLIVTAPTVAYELLITDGLVVSIDSPSKLLSYNKIKEIREPIVLCNIFSPKKYIGDIITLCIEKRGLEKSIIYYENHVRLIYKLPMSEVILDFFNRIKAISHGYASFDYEFDSFKTENIVCVEIAINGKRIDTLAIITHYRQAVSRGHALVDRLQVLIPRQQFDVVIQAMVNNRVIYRNIVKQLRKNVLSKCSGGDVTRKKKLLHKQKEGKKRMKKIGNVHIPYTVFLSVLEVNN